jgi:hypothetical protein
MMLCLSIYLSSLVKHVLLVMSNPVLTHLTNGSVSGVQQDLGLFLVMIVYQGIVEYGRPFSFASLDPVSAYVYMCFVATFVLLCTFRDW